MSLCSPQSLRWYSKRNGYWLNKILFCPHFSWFSFWAFSWQPSWMGIFPLLSLWKLLCWGSSVGSHMPISSFFSAFVLNLSTMFYDWPPWNLFLFVPWILGTSCLITAACSSRFLLLLPKMKSASLPSQVSLWRLSTAYCHQPFFQCRSFTTLPSLYLSTELSWQLFKLSSRHYLEIPSWPEENNASPGKKARLLLSPWSSR